MSSIVEKIISNLLIAAVVPSTIFVIILVILFPLPWKSMIAELPGRLINQNGFLNNIGVFIFAASFLLGLSLVHLVESIFSIYQARFLPKQFSWLQRKKYESLVTKIKELDDKYKKLFDEYQGLKDDKLKELNLIERNLIKDQRTERQVMLDRSFPPRINLILPTRFGNIMAAAESYPTMRYGINYGNNIYVRLLGVIDGPLNNRLDDTRTQTAFLIFLSFLSGVLSILFFVAALYFAVDLNSWGNTSVIHYSVYTGLFAMFSCFFYSLSLSNLQRYCDCYRSIFDLYRFELLKKLHIELPQDSDREKERWLSVCERITLGETDDAPLYTPFCHSPNAIRNSDDSLDKHE